MSIPITKDSRPRDFRDLPLLERTQAYKKWCQISGYSNEKAMQLGMTIDEYLTHITRGEASTTVLRTGDPLTTTVAHTYVPRVRGEVVEEQEPTIQTTHAYAASTERDGSSPSPPGTSAIGAPRQSSTIHAADALAEIDGRSYGKIIRSISARFNVRPRNAEKFLADAVSAKLADVQSNGRGRPSFYTLTERGVRYRDQPNPRWRNNLREREANNRRSEAASSDVME